MYNYNIFIEQEDDLYIAHNLELWIASQWDSYDEAIKNLKEATMLFLEDENKESIFSNIKNRNYSLLTMSI